MSCSIQTDTQRRKKYNTEIRACCACANFTTRPVKWPARSGSVECQFGACRLYDAVDGALLGLVVQDENVVSTLIQSEYLSELSSTLEALPTPNPFSFNVLQ